MWLRSFNEISNLEKGGPLFGEVAAKWSAARIAVPRWIEPTGIATARIAVLRWIEPTGIATARIAVPRWIEPTGIVTARIEVPRWIEPTGIHSNILHSLFCFVQHCTKVCVNNYAK